MFSVLEREDIDVETRTARTPPSRSRDTVTLHLHSAASQGTKHSLPPTAMAPSTSPSTDPALSAKFEVLVRPKVLQSSSETWYNFKEFRRRVTTEAEHVVFTVLPTKVRIPTIS